MASLPFFLQMHCGKCQVFFQEFLRCLISAYYASKFESYRIFAKRSGNVYMVNISKPFFQNFDLGPQMGRRPKIGRKFIIYRIFAKRSGYVYMLNISTRIFSVFWFGAPNGPQAPKRAEMWKSICSFSFAWINKIFVIWLVQLMRKNKIKAEFWLRAPNLKILDPKVSKISKWCNVYRIFTKRSGYVYMVNISRRFFQNFDLRPQMGRRPKIRQKFESYRIFAKRSGYVYMVNISIKFFFKF